VPFRADRVKTALAKRTDEQLIMHGRYAVIRAE
jgi:hypothetical protein